jgi:hypothetical protein
MTLGHSGPPHKLHSKGCVARLCHPRRLCQRTAAVRHAYSMIGVSFAVGRGVAQGCPLSQSCSTSSSMTYRAE